MGLFSLPLSSFSLPPSLRADSAVLCQHNFSHGQKKGVWTIKKAICLGSDYWFILPHNGPVSGLFALCFGQDMKKRKEENVSISGIEKCSVLCEILNLYLTKKKSQLNSPLWIPTQWNPRKQIQTYTHSLLSHCVYCNNPVSLVRSDRGESLHKHTDWNTVPLQRNWISFGQLNVLFVL